MKLNHVMFLIVSLSQTAFADQPLTRTTGATAPVTGQRLSAPAVQGGSFKGMFELSPAGSFTVTSSKVTQNLVRMSDGSFQASSIEIPVLTLTTSNALRDDHMKNKYLEARKFPKATLTQLKAKDRKFEGILNLHGVQRKIAGEYELENNTVKAKFPLNLKDYSINVPTYLGVGVEEEANIEVSLPFTKSH